MKSCRYVIVPTRAPSSNKQRRVPSKSCGGVQSGKHGSRVAGSSLALAQPLLRIDELQDLVTASSKFWNQLSSYPPKTRMGRVFSPDASTTGQFAQTDLSENSNTEAEEIRRPVALFQAILPGKPSGQEEKR